jgi:hypothetical protein
LHGNCPPIILEIIVNSQFNVKIRKTFRQYQDEQNEISHNKIGDTLKLENLTLKMKISFEEVLPPDVLYAVTQNRSNFSILWAF